MEALSKLADAGKALAGKAADVAEKLAGKAADMATGSVDLFTDTAGQVWAKAVEMGGGVLDLVVGVLKGALALLGGGDGA